jgi:hypothetical protein
LGLKLRYNLFYQVPPQDVYSAYQRFYSQQDATLIDEGDEFEAYELYEPNNAWTILHWNGGWEWKIRRDAQLFVSRELDCLGFLIFVYDGQYWGYEFFKAGQVLDHFVQDMEDGTWQFPDEPCIGNTQLLAAHLNWLSPDDIAPYLVQTPYADDDTDLKQFREYKRSLNVPPRPHDEYTRFYGLAVLNFLRLLGINISVVDGYVTPETPIWRTFWIKGSV